MYELFLISRGNGIGSDNRVRTSRTNKRGEVDTLIVLAAAGMWMTVLFVIGLAVTTAAMNELQELV